MTEDYQALTTELYSHLEATAERPVDREASRWIGEAEAVAGDVAGGEVPPDVLEERIGHVERLLAEVEDTGDPEANEHVEEARRLAETLLEELAER